MRFSKLIVAPFLGGALFSLGLGVSKMTEPAKVISFLDLSGNWDPSLIFVMMGAIGVNSILHRLITSRPKPLFESRFDLPSNHKIDRKLLVGSALFGIGWGITGLCPGPGIAGLSTGNFYSIAFVAALILGMAIIKVFETRSNPA